MKAEENKNEIEKTQVFNLIILDRSGSMELIREAAIEGFNRTLAGIKKAQEKYADTQDHYVSLVTFCGCGIDDVFYRTPVSETRPLTMEDYRPCCDTPLYDAMVTALISLYYRVWNIDDSVVVVTIITDGLENASRKYDGTDIQKLVKRLRLEGWTFTYMGANQDSFEVATNLSIRNARNFSYSNEGTLDSMCKDANTRMNFFSRLAELKRKEINGCTSVMSEVERHRRYTDMADEAFDEEEGKCQ